jgi:hypothetical protein
MPVLLAVAITAVLMLVVIASRLIAERFEQIDQRRRSREIQRWMEDRRL